MYRETFAECVCPVLPFFPNMHFLLSPQHCHHTFLHTDLHTPQHCIPLHMHAPQPRPNCVIPSPLLSSLPGGLGGDGGDEGRGEGGEGRGREGRGREGREGKGGEGKGGEGGEGKGGGRVWEGRGEGLTK